MLVYSKSVRSVVGEGTSTSSEWVIAAVAGYAIWTLTEYLGHRFLFHATFPGKLGVEIRETICADCWNEWLKMEVMVINELRLSLMDPSSQETLNRHMREFLFSGGGEIEKNPDPRP